MRSILPIQADSHPYADLGILRCERNTSPNIKPTKSIRFIWRPLPNGYICAIALCCRAMNKHSCVPQEATRDAQHFLALPQPPHRKF